MTELMEMEGMEATVSRRRRTTKDAAAISAREAARAKYRHALVMEPGDHVPEDLIKPRYSHFMWDYWDKMEDCYALLLDGPRGTTKTTLAYAYAAERERPLLVVNCQPDMTPEALLGSQQIKSGTSYWQPGLLQIAAETDAVVLFDEFNLMPSGVMAALNPICDGVQKGIFNPYTTERIDWPNPRIIFAVNTGYAGTRTIQEAFKDRCETLLARYLSPKDETALLQSRTGVDQVEATVAVKVATAIRADAEKGRFEFDLSPRALIRHCQLVKLGYCRNLSWTQTVMHRIGWSVTTETTWIAVSELSRSIGNYQVKSPSEPEKETK